ncbi:MAG TPA: hypothetical protein VF017_21630 [Thermoanaerobaculia bacterium]|nr:hypothetical protein [Thermoanaerobaculia bacterium]
MNLAREARAARGRFWRFGFLRCATSPLQGATAELEFVYDDAERLIEVNEVTGATTSRPLKVLTYGAANQGTNKRLGKLETATRYNYVDLAILIGQEDRHPHPQRYDGQRDVQVRQRKPHQGEGWGQAMRMLLKACPIIVRATLALTLSLGCSPSEQEGSGARFSPAQGQSQQAPEDRALEEWARGLDVLERSLTGRYEEREFGDACQFFQALTGIEVHGEGETLGWFPTAETSRDLDRLNTWYAANGHRLYWDETTSTVQVRVLDRLPQPSSPNGHPSER